MRASVRTSLVVRAPDTPGAGCLPVIHNGGVGGVRLRGWTARHRRRLARMWLELSIAIVMEDIWRRIRRGGERKSREMFMLMQQAMWENDSTALDAALRQAPGVGALDE